MSEENESAGFKWTGHPFIDFGVAVLMARCQVDEPEHLTNDKVAEFTEEAEDAYFTKPDLATSIEIAGFRNYFFQPTYSEQKKRELVKASLNAYSSTPNPELPKCVFFHTPSVEILNRDRFPLIQGRDQINFYPGGQSGIGVSGQALTAIQALMFGALRSQGKLMILEADDPNLLRAVVREWTEKIRLRIHLGQLGKEAGEIGPPKTTLISTLEGIESARISQKKVGEQRYHGGATLYHFSNSGQGPSLELYPLPAAILSFVTTAKNAEYYTAWVEIELRSWPKPKPAKKGTSLPEDHAPESSKKRGLPNYFYEALFTLPDEASKFVSRYFLATTQTLVKRAANLDVQEQQNSISKVKALWNLTELFMEEVLEVRSERIQDIKELGDRLAEIARANRRRYSDFLQVRGDWFKIRQLLLRVSRREVADEHKPILSLDQYLSVFQINEDLEKPDWGLAWDLVLIRMIERVYELDPKFFKDDSDAISDDEADTSESTTIND